VHFALSQSSDPKAVLLIGSGIAGLAGEILKHPVSELDYVELDPELINMAKDNVPSEKLAFLEDKRLHLLHQDGRLFIKQKKAAAYDVIIASLGDPYTAQINRFYTLEFFQEIKQSLSSSGIFSFSLSASENFLNREQKQFLSSIYKTLGRVFAEVKMIPGDTVYFLAANEEGILTYEHKKLMRRLKRRGVKTKFVREYYLFAKMSEDRISYLEESIDQAKDVKINTDFHPISYYYDMVLWSTRFVRPWRKIFSQISEFSLWSAFSLAYLAIIVSAFLRRKKKRPHMPFVLLAVGTTGFAELSFQIVILLAFQIIYGYLYYKLGVILSAFMLGLVLGSRVITSKLNTIKNHYELFIKTQVAISCYPLILPFVFLSLNKASGAASVAWLGSNIIFPLLPIVAGFVGGFQFPLANKIILQGNAGVGATSGLSYGMDLFGSCLGALLVSAFLVPILGLTEVCIMIALLNSAVLIALVIRRDK